MKILTSEIFLLDGMSGFIDLYQTYVPLSYLCINFVSAYKHPNVHHTHGGSMLANLVNSSTSSTVLFYLNKNFMQSYYF